MTFAFNFSVGSHGSEGRSGPSHDDGATQPLQADPCVEWFCTDQAAYTHSEHEELIISDSLSLLKGNVSSVEASALLQDNGLAVSDLVPGQYEGGFKLWECAIDLAAHVHQQQMSGKLQLAGKRVLELGCGHGLPGIAALLAGAEVHFQDYNQVVLSRLTAPNAAANQAESATLFPGGHEASASSRPDMHPSSSTQTSDQGHAGTVPAAGQGVKNSRASGDSKVQQESASSSCRYFAGDWGSMPAFLDEHGLSGSYDLVVSAETIYSIESQRALHDCILECLRPPDGEALIAAKTHYFGVGGSVATFKQLVHAQQRLHIESVATHDDGRSNCREILRLTLLN